jgi:hypothetical protein
MIGLTVYMLYMYNSMKGCADIITTTKKNITPIYSGHIVRYRALPEGSEDQNTVV